MQTIKRPYELLIRWDQQGTLSGAHVQWRYVIEDAGRLVGESVSQAEPLRVGEFPLTDLLTQVQADALAEVERLKAEAAHLHMALTAAQQRIAVLEASLADAE